jgi:hypothetical protein
MRVGRAEELSDRVRVETPTGSPADLPAGVRAERVGARTFEIPRRDIQGVLPLADPAGAARPPGGALRGDRPTAHRPGPPRSPAKLAPALHPGSRLRTAAQPVTAGPQ